MKLTREEKELLESVERGEWQRVADYDEQAKRLLAAAKTTFRKDKRVNIRISERDLTKLQVRALEEGLPYQTLIASILHKYVTGRLAETTTSAQSDASQAIERARVEAGLTGEELLTIVREHRVDYDAGDDGA